MMHMTFYWGKEMTLLVNSWRTDSWTGYVLSLLACFIASVFYQYLENLRVSLKRPSQQGKANGVEAPLLQQAKGGLGSSVAVKLTGAVMFGVNSGLGYLLMLAVMSFNGGVFVAVVLGLSVGYLFFRSGDDEVAVVDNPCACA